MGSPTEGWDRFPALLVEHNPGTASVLAVVCVVFVLSTLGSFLANTCVNTAIPLVGKELGHSEKRRRAFVKGARDLYAAGYRAFKNSAFRLTDNEGERIIVSHNLVDELKDLPDDHVSINKALRNSVAAKYTGVDMDPQRSHFAIHVIRGDLTRGLNRINSRLSGETARTVVDELPPCEDWTSMVIYDKLVRMVAIISGSIFLGPDLCRREEYLYHAVHYTIDVFEGARKIKEWHPALRPIGQFFVPEMRTIKEHREKAHAFLGPVIRERRALLEAGGEPPDDMLSWMLKKSAEHGVKDEDVVGMQLELSMAAIHTTTLTTTLLLYDLATQPELVEELRAEITAALDANDGVLTTKALFDMKLLDSAMKESLRTNPLALNRFDRYIEKPVTLSDGTRLPAGVSIAAPHTDVVSDPEHYTNPDVFDPYRFLNLRNGTAVDPLNYKNKEQYQFATVTKDFMHFGYGRHACPGRFFAANEIKLIVAHLLVEFDVKLPPGVSRYEAVSQAARYHPDPRKELMLRRVRSKS